MEATANNRLFDNKMTIWTHDDTDNLPNRELWVYLYVILQYAMAYIEFKTCSQM